MSQRLARVLFGKYADAPSDVTHLALKAWPAILARPDVAPEAAAEMAYRAAVAMLEEVRQAEGAYDITPWRAEGGA